MQINMHQIDFSIYLHNIDDELLQPNVIPQPKEQPSITKSTVLPIQITIYY